MADVGDPAVPLALDGRLVRAPGLKVVVTHERHVAMFRLVLGRNGGAGGNSERDDECDAGASHETASRLGFRRPSLPTFSSPPPSKRITMSDDFLQDLRYAARSL